MSPVQSCGTPETGYGANREVFARAAAGREAAGAQRLVASREPDFLRPESRGGGRGSIGAGPQHSRCAPCARHGAYENAAAASAAAPRIT